MLEQKNIACGERVNIPAKLQDWVMSRKQAMLDNDLVNH
jgi:hypothetical protein